MGPTKGLVDAFIQRFGELIHQDTFAQSRRVLDDAVCNEDVVCRVGRQVGRDIDRHVCCVKRDLARIGNEDTLVDRVAKGFLDQDGTGAYLNILRKRNGSGHCQLGTR